jgi:hypothetical protein
MEQKEVKSRKIQKRFFSTFGEKDSQQKRGKKKVETPMRFFDF